MQQAGALRLLEGLPHPMNEQQLFARERKRTDIQDRHGHWFYAEALNAPPELLQSVRDIVANAASFARLTGTKFCGGFHPDYALEWQNQGADRITLLCFGCRESKLFGSGRSNHVDMTEDAAKRLQELLKGVRQFRPER